MPLFMSILKAVSLGFTVSEVYSVALFPVANDTTGLSFISNTVLDDKFKYVVMADVARLVSRLISFRSLIPSETVITVS